MSESNPSRYSTARAGSRPEPREWPEKRFLFVYAAIVIYTAATIFGLWLFSRAFA